MLLSITISALAAVPDVDTPLKVASSAPTDAAVVIGIEDYGFLASVPFANRDARAMYHLLAYTRGVPLERIELLSGGNREQILAAVQRAREKLGPKGTLWIVFTGHGATSPQTGELMLVGDDAKPDPNVFVSRSIPVSLLGEGAVLMLDTCFAGRGRDGSELMPGTRFAVPVYADQGPSEGASVIAASPGQISEPYRPAEHGLFTYFFAGALRGWADGEIDSVRDGQITLKEAHTYTARALATVHPSGQQPMWTGEDRVVITADPALLESGPDLGALPKVGEPSSLVVSAPSLIGTPVPFMPMTPIIARPLHWGDGGELIDSKGRVHDLGSAIASSPNQPGLARAWQGYQLDTAAKTYGASLFLSGAILGGAMLYTSVQTGSGDFGLYTATGAGMSGLGAVLFTYGAAHRSKSREKLLGALNGER